MGYAVLQPQFRGSGGFTVSFTAAGYGQFGRKMQTDISDGVRYLAGQGIVDPSRVCIAGASYGGYAAMAGVTLQSGIYRCAVAVSGIADLRRREFALRQAIVRPRVIDHRRRILRGGLRRRGA
jgi:dipeptidyl aminopeptidase/acylaminoacyl peptidase